MPRLLNILITVGQFYLYRDFKGMQEIIYRKLAFAWAQHIRTSVIKARPQIRSFSFLSVVTVCPEVVFAFKKVVFAFDLKISITSHLSLPN